ncbi:hypothetical protein GCM10022265_09910 [Marinobacter xestospongiae]
MFYLLSVPLGEFADLLRDAGASGLGANPQVWWCHIKDWKHRPEAPASRPSGATESLDSRVTLSRFGTTKPSPPCLALKALSGSVD